MKKVFRLRDLDCANCARKMEDAIRKIEGVEDVQVSFMTQKLTLAPLREAEKVVRRRRVVVRQGDEHGGGTVHLAALVVAVSLLRTAERLRQFALFAVAVLPQFPYPAISHCRLLPRLFFISIKHRNSRH